MKYPVGVMRSNVFWALIIVALLIGLPFGVIAGEPAAADSDSPVLTVSPPAGTTMDENTLLPNLPDQ